MADEGPQQKRETVLGALTRFLTGRRRALTEEELQENVFKTTEFGYIPRTVEK